MTNELTDVRCSCGDEYPADSYDAGFIAGSGMCQNCDAALPPKDICTCPSGDSSLRHPCPAHPASVDLAGVAAKLTFINGRPAMCGCQVEYSSGGGEYSDVIDVTLCAKHSGSAILDLVATNRIALTPEYEGQWHADLYLDREIPLAKAEGATPAEAVLALMSAERIDPEQESVGQAGGDERAAFFKHLIGRHPAHETEIVRVVEHNYAAWKAWQARAALAQPSPVRSSLLINGYQLRAALEFIAPDGTAKQLESEARIEWRQQDADFLEAGLYAWCAEYPEEGCVLLDEEPATAQPSPAQAEQAEPERPEVVAWQYRVTAGPQTGWSLWHPGKGEEFERSYTVERRPLMTVAQHERIVGELRAVIAQLRQHKNDYMDSGQETYRALQNEIREREAEIARLDGLVSGRTAERDAALAEVERLRQFERICGGLPQDAIDGGWTVQGIRGYAKRLEDQLKSALARVAELETKLAELETQEPAGWLAHYFGGKRNGRIYGGPCNTKEEIDRYIQQVERSDDSITLQGKPFYAAPVAQPEETPGEILAAKLIETWVTKHGKPAPWSTAIEITAVATNMPNDERDRLLALDDDVDTQAQHSVPEGGTQ
ncbi:TPA: hypothetical protein L4S33_000124 [Pseudomonas aeruginosa]|nr:hypothetical protein [Pseudomonas aeruginosa]